MQDSTSDEFVSLSEMKRRILNACLDKAIMAEMAQRSAFGAKEIIDFFEKKFNIRISPGTIYPILYKLEKTGYIRKLPNRIKKFYELTDSGKKSLENLQDNMVEVYGFLADLVNK
jgi:DNA-binding PadR family transcriptional regulator